MFEYASVSASSYDIDSLVAKLNERSASGWEVVSVVSTGGEVSAILRRESSGSSMVDAASSSASSTASAAMVDVAPAPEPAPAVAPVSEPAGWAVAPEPAAEPAPVASYEPAAAASYEPAAAASYEPAAAASYEPAQTTSYDTAAAVSPIEVSTPQATVQPAAAPASAIPAGWFPDPSTRFEMRYWDGTAWTEHVARQGQQFTDPPVA